MQVIIVVLLIVTVCLLVVKRKESLNRMFNGKLMLPPDVYGLAEKIAKHPDFLVGDTLVHNETRQRVVITSVPSFIDGEYKIRWESGGIGEIHEVQLQSWFSKV